MPIRTILAVALPTLLVLGCLPPKTEDDKTKSKKAQSLAKQLAGGGLDDPGGNPAGNPNAKPVIPPPGGFKTNRVAGKRGIVGQMTNQVVDYHAALKKRPDLKVTRKPKGNSFISSTYISAVGRVSIAAFDHNMQILYAMNGRWPTYKEYMTQMKSMQVDLAMLPHYQVYAYNDKDGKLYVLEDPELKAKSGQ